MTLCEGSVGVTEAPDRLLEAEGSGILPFVDVDAVYSPHGRFSNVDPQS